MLRRGLLALGLLLALGSAAEACNTYDRVFFATATAGTGSADVGAPEAGYSDPADLALADATCVYYTIEDGSDYEVGIGTYQDAVTDTIDRDTVIQSQIAGVVGTTKLTLSGAAKIFFTLPAPYTALLTRDQTWTGTQTFNTAAPIFGIGLLPDANDGAFIGAAATSFSDLYLAEGGTITWDNTDCILTQTGNALATTGCTISLASLDEPTLGTNTAGVYVAQVADGTGIDGTANAEGATYTPTLDLTEISSATLGAGAFTTLTFDAGATDPVFTFASNSFTISGAAAVSIGNNTFTTGTIEMANGTANTLSAAAGVLSIEGVALVPNTRTITGGVGIAAMGDLSADRTVTLDLTEVNSATFGSGTFTTLTFDAGATDPILTFGSNSLAISNAATFTVGGLTPTYTTRTLTGGTGIAAIGDLSADRTVTLDLTEISSATWGAGAFTAFTFDAGAVDPVLTFGSGTLTLTAMTTLNLDDEGEFRLFEEDAGGANYKGFKAPAAVTASTTCTFEDDANFIPDSCVGDGTDAGGSLGDADYGDITVSGAGTVWDVDSDASISGATPLITIVGTDAGAVGPILKLQHDSASAADGDIAADIQAFAGADDEEVGRIALEVDDGATTTEDTQWRIFTDVAGTSAQKLAIAAGVLIGNGTTFPAAEDLSIEGGDIEFGNAGTAGTDTTFGYTSAGDVAVEGNRIFRVGGADVPVADGGTGASSLNDLITLTTHTAGVYVAQVADGTGVDGTANAEGATYTPTLDFTEISSLTWGAGAFTTMTFDSGATDPVFTFASAKTTLSSSDLHIADANGIVLGHSAQLTTFEFIGTPEFQELGTGDADTTFGLGRWSADNLPSRILLAKSRGATIGTMNIVSDGDYIGCYMFQAADGVAMLRAGEICYQVNGTPGVNDMPSAVTFATTSDGAASPTVRWSINSLGALSPITDNSYDIGTAALGVDQLFVDNVELGTATDTTILKSAAGEATLEGDAIKHAGKQMFWVGAGAMRNSALTPASCGDTYDSGTQDVTTTVCAFDTGATEENAEFGFAMPKSQNASTITMQFAWTNTAGLTTETVQWKIACTGFGDDDALNTAYPADVTVSDTWTAQNDYTLTAETSAITIQNLASLDYVNCRIGRDTSVDNMTGDVLLIGAKVFWTDNASTMAE